MKKALLCWLMVIPLMSIAPPADASWFSILRIFSFGARASTIPRIATGVGAAGLAGAAAGLAAGELLNNNENAQAQMADGSRQLSIEKHKAPEPYLVINRVELGDPDLVW